MHMFSHMHVVHRPHACISPRKLFKCLLCNTKQVHAKCLRSVDDVRSYFRKYRQRAKSSVQVGFDNECRLACNACSQLPHTCT